jgi:hypothetical protein
VQYVGDALRRPTTEGGEPKPVNKIQPTMDWPSPVYRRIGQGPTSLLPAATSFERFDVSNFRDAPRSAARTNVASPPNIGVAGRDARFPLTGELLIFARLGLHPPIFAVVPYEEAQASALTVSWP